MVDIVQDPGETQLDVWYLERIIVKTQTCKTNKQTKNICLSFPPIVYVISLFQTMRI